MSGGLADRCSDFPLRPVLLEGDRARVDPPGKVNLFLEVIARRADGYHDIETLLIPIELRDTLEVTLSETGHDQLEVIGDGAPEGPDNLVISALEMVRSVREIPPLSIRLSKRIPTAAGLGGGSADAAGMLALINHLFPTEGGVAQKQLLARHIGSDVSFFLGSGPAIARGRGDRLGPVPEPFLGGDRPAWLLVVPEERVETSSCYRQIPFPLTCPDGPITFPTRTFESCDLWREGIFNRLWHVVEARHPGLRALGRSLEEAVPGKWSMSGSGSTFFVVCESWGEAEDIADTLRRELAGEESPRFEVTPVKPWNS